MEACGERSNIIEGSMSTLTELRKDVLSDARVALTKLSSPEYSERSDEINRALRKMATDLEWAEEARGAFGKIIPAGARVLIKPNLVLHENQGPWGMDAVVTHFSLIREVVEAVLQADPRQVVIGDAPLQGCDFERLLSIMGMDRWAENMKQRDSRFKGVRDFRRTTCVFVNGVRMAAESLQSEENFVLFDLGEKSLLEPISDGRDSFRVTCYDPRLLAKTHAPGKHRFLVAKEIIEADIVINLPKLKTHKKAGITCALKNLIGINGNKEYLPHHRVGGPHSGGDCYPEHSPIKRLIEYSSDQEHTSASFATAGVWHGIGKQLDRISRLMGDQLGTEGSWIGNDTIWRTCLDLNRILHYGRTDATLANQPQRKVFHIVDAVIAGQGDGPLSPQPLPLGMLLAGHNAAAVDWVGAYLLGYDPRKLSIVRNAFEKFEWPLNLFAADQVELVGDWKTGLASEVFNGMDDLIPVIHPIGWRDAARKTSR